MSRLKNFSRNLALSYLQLGVNTGYSLISIPLILHWLPKTEFGLWAVLGQIMGYMSLLDIGMTGAAARLLVEHKDERANGNYGSMLKTVMLVSLCQGFIILMVTFFGSPVLASLMKIPAENVHLFVVLMGLQGVITAFNFTLRPLGMMLYAHQRMDIQSYNDMFNLAAQLALLLGFLNAGCGIYSFIYGNMISAVLSPLYLYWNCRRLGLLPKANEWGKVSGAVFVDIFHYGKNIFFMGLGVQLTMATQVMLVSRNLGLEAAAAWAVGTKLFNLFSPLMCRPYGASLPGLYEMAARNEFDRLYKRYKEMVVLTVNLGVFLGVILGMCNCSFVTIWTSGRVSWSHWNDFFLGVWIFFSSLQTTHMNFVNVTKQFGIARYVYFLEGACFVTISMLLGGRGGLIGILVASNICQILFSCNFGFRLTARYFKCSWPEVAFQWIAPSYKFAAYLLPVAILTWLLTMNFTVMWRLIVHSTVMGVVGGILFIKFGFPRAMLMEAKSRLPKLAGRVLELLLLPI